MYRSIPFLILGLLLLGGAYYYLLYPPTLTKREAQRVLNRLEAAVETQNSAEVKHILGAVLADNAQITLDVRLPSSPGQQAGAVKETFSKPDFIGFIDTTLYSLSDYHYKAAVQSLSLNADKTSGALIFSALSDARDMAGSLGSMMRVLGQHQCTAELQYAAGKPTVITHLSCNVTLKYTLAGAGEKRN